MKRSGKTSAFLWSCLILSAIFYFTGCNGGSSSDSEAPVPETTSKIGSKGGTVTDEGGSSVVIPPGALSKETEITVITYRDGTALPDEMWSSLFGENGAAEFLPDGLTFALPVTITVPSTVSLTPGDEIPLFQWNDPEGAWEQTDFTARVNPDGLSWSAEVTHFTTFSTGGWGNFPSPGLGNLDDPDSIDPDEARAALEGRFTEWIDEFESKVHSLGEVKRKNDCVMEIQGLKYHMDYGQGKFHYSSDRTKGKTDGCHAWETLKYKYGPPDGSYQYFFTVEICWMRLLARVTVTATPDTIEIPPEGPDRAPKAKVEATVEFVKKDGGTLTYAGFLVTFTLQNSNTGELFPETCPTDDSGKAFVYFHPKNPGTATVTATVSTCGCPGDPTVIDSKGQTKIVVTQNAWVAGVYIEFEEIGAWTGNEYFMFHYKDCLYMDVPFTIDEEGAVQSNPDCSLGDHCFTGVGWWDEGPAPVIEATRSECSIRNIDLGPYQGLFKVTASGCLNGNILTLNIHPVEPLTITFDIFCKSSDENWEQTIPWPNMYGVNEWGIMQDKLKVEIPLIDLADSGPGEVGTVAFGDTVLRYWFKVNLRNEFYCLEWPADD